MPMSITEYDAASMKTGLPLVVSRWAARWPRRRVTDSPLFSMSGMYSTLCRVMLQLCWEFGNFVTASVLILIDQMPTALRFIPLISLGECFCCDGNKIRFVSREVGRGTAVNDPLIMILCEVFCW